VADLVEVRVACPDARVAQAIADALVAERLAACVQVLDGMTSTYAWQGRVHRDAEVLLLAKTTAGRFDALAVRVDELHPYETPEILGLDVAHALERYAAWVRDQVG
jgi:periplasmic divalent cation tolerance protein